MDPFEVLEKKIDQLLDVIKESKKQCQELHQKNLELKTIVSQKDNQLLSLKGELEKYQNAQIEITEYKNKQNNVKNKVETLLAKLKEFEELE